MLSIFFTIFGSIGVFLNWPVIQEGVFTILTKPWNQNQLFSILQRYSSGHSRLDGAVIIGVSAIILFSVFIRTKKIILNLRILFLVIIMAILSAELFTVLKLRFPFYAFTGLLYSTIFYFFAFISAVFRIGSMKSFNSTFMGKPMSESRAFSQTFSQVLSRVSKTLQISFVAEDNINAEWNKGGQRKYSSSEIKVGRDNNWADLLIGEEWNMVSNQHGILRIIGNSLIYEPVSSLYAYAVNGKPFIVPKEIPNQSRLTLVSGIGPVLNVFYQFQKQPIMHPKTMLRAGEIARDEFKKLQSTLKTLIIMVFLGLPLLWFFSGIQKKVLGNYINQIKIQNEQFNQELKDKAGHIEELNQESKKNQSEINRLKNKINRLKEMEILDHDGIENTQNRIEKLENINFSEKITGELRRIAKVIDIKLCSQRISVYFPYLTVFGKDKITTGTGFFLKDRKGMILLATEKSRVLDTFNPKDTRTFFFLFPDSWNAFNQYYTDLNKRNTSISDLHQELEKNTGRYNLLVIDGKKWKQFGPEYGKNSVVTTSIKNFPGYLLPYVPRMDSNVSRSDRVIVYGFQWGKKIYFLANVLENNSRIITVQCASTAGFSGALLIKVLSEGNYSAVGVSHLAGRTGYTSKWQFLAFSP